MYLVCTASEPRFTGFQGVQHDANMQVPDAQQPVQGVEYGYLPVPHFRVRASRTATEGGGSPGYATATPARQDRREGKVEF